MVVNTVKERPYTAAALATVAAGAAAFFLTRGKSDKPLMKWGQEPQGNDGASGTSPSAAQAASLAASDTSTNAAASGGTGASFSPAAAMRATTSATERLRTPLSTTPPRPIPRSVPSLTEPNRF